MKKYLTIGATILLIATIWFAPSAYAAIGFDAQATTQNVNLTTVTTPITVTSSQSNLYLIVGISSLKTTGSSTVSSVVGAGQTLSLLVATTSASASTSWNLYGVANPNTGSQNVTTTFASSQNFFEICVMSFYGVAQSNSVDATGSNWLPPLVTTVSSTLTTQNANDVIASFAAHFAGAGPASINPTPGSGDTGTCSANTGGEHQGGAYRSIPTAGATSTIWNNGSSTYGMVAASLVPFVAAGSGASNANSQTMASIGSGIFNVANASLFVKGSRLNIQ